MLLLIHKNNHVKGVKIFMKYVERQKKDFEIKLEEPMPFTRGDIVSFRSRPLIVDDMPHWWDDHNEMLLCNSDSIAATAYCVDRTGTLERWIMTEVFHEFEFWEGNFDTPYLFIPELSRFVKGEDKNIARLLNLFHIFKIKVNRVEEDEAFDELTDDRGLFKEYSCCRFIYLHKGFAIIA